MSTATTQSPNSPAVSSSRRRLPGWMRWLHTYLSMIGLGVLLFFSLTGLTLNHPDWLFGSHRREQRFNGTIETKWLAPGSTENSIDKLAIVEYLRRQHAVRGMVDDFRVDDVECDVSFKGPGSFADVAIKRATGAYELTTASEGWVALVNDLHKGRHTGRSWAILIDVTAILLTFAAVSGLWLLFYVQRRRTSGLWIGLAGIAVLWICYRFGVL